MIPTYGKKRAAFNKALKEIECTSEFYKMIGERHKEEYKTLLIFVFTIISALLLFIAYAIFLFIWG